MRKHGHIDMKYCIYFSKLGVMVCHILDCYQTIRKYIKIKRIISCNVVYATNSFSYIIIRYRIVKIIHRIIHSFNHSKWYQIPFLVCFVLETGHNINPDVMKQVKNCWCDDFIIIFVLLQFIPTKTHRHTHTHCTVSCLMCSDYRRIYRWDNYVTYRIDCNSCDRSYWPSWRPLRYKGSVLPL